MFLREIENKGVYTYAKEISPGVWEECGWSVFRDNMHRLALVKKKTVKGVKIKIYQVV